MGWKHKSLKKWLSDILFTVIVMCAAFGANILLRTLLPSQSLTPMIFVFGVFLISLKTKGYILCVISAILSVIATNFAFTYPYYSFTDLISGENVFSAILMLVIAIVTSSLNTAIRVQDEVRAESEKEKMRANLLRAISHDLRTPLTSIYGATSTVMDNYDSLTKEQQLKLLSEVQADSEWLIRMVENLLTITRMDGSNGARVTKSPEAGEEVLETAAVKFRKQFPNWKLTVQAPAEFLLIPMDAVLIEQVLMNLLENAVDHATGGDQIWLSLERLEHQAAFTVRDNGCGLDPALLPHIFESKANAGSGGDRKRNMGIGLSVCNTIIKAHGGAMEAENTEQGGAAFRFTLPLEEEAHE